MPLIIRHLKAEHVGLIFRGDGPQGDHLLVPQSLQYRLVAALRVSHCLQRQELLVPLEEETFILMMLFHIYQLVLDL
jgi:hypothetical protein